LPSLVMHPRSRWTQYNREDAEDAGVGVARLLRFGAQIHETPFSEALVWTLLA
jgi:hypothetical protein